MNNKIFESFNDIKIPGSFSGLETFYKQLKKSHKKLDKEKLKNWLKTQDSYTLHHPIKKTFKRNKFFTYGIDHIWQADLCDVSNISSFNNDYNYLLTCIDVFSKFAWVIPIKNKTSTTIIDCFKQIFDSGRIPKKIQTDEGKEFFNKNFQNFLKNHNVILYKTNSELKAAVVERFNRTLKEKMYKYFTHYKTNNYLKIINELVSNYNKSYHRTIKTSPINVKKSNEYKIWKNIYKLDRDEKIKFKYKEGDQVLITKNKSVFSKGYLPKWVREVFIISEKIPRYPPVYKIKDRLNREIEGVFYEQELQKIKKETFEIEKILKTRTKNGKKENLVRWEGYSKDFDSWIPELKNEFIPDITK